MAKLEVQAIDLNGLSPTFVAADSLGDTFVNYGKTILHAVNDGTAAKQITISSNPCNYGGSHDIVVSVPAGEERQIGDFPTTRFNDENHEVNISYDTVTSLTVAAIKY